MMNEVFFFLLTALVTAGAFMFFVKKDRDNTVKLAAVFIKASMIWAIMAGFAGAGAVFYAVFILSICAGLFILSSARGGIEGNKTREYVVFVFSLGLLLIFASGCTSSENMKMPVVSRQMNLNFTASCLTAGDNGEVYAGFERTGAVSVIDTVNGKNLSAFTAGLMPVEIILSGKKIYTANKMSNSVTIYDTEKPAGISVASGGTYPSALALDAVNNKLYVANMGSNNVAVIDLSAPGARVKALIPTGKWPSDLYLAPDNRYLYVCCKYTNTVQIIDTERGLLVFTKIDTGISPSQLVPLNKKEIAIINEWEYTYNHSSSIIVFNRISYDLEYDMTIDGGI